MKTNVKSTERILRLTETKEEGVDGHSVNAEKQSGNEIGAQRGRDDRYQIVIGRRYVRINVIDFAAEYEERGQTDGADDDQTADKEQEIRHFIQNGDTYHVAQQQFEGFAGRFTEIGASNGTHDVSVTIDESHKLFQ